MIVNIVIIILIIIIIFTQNCKDTNLVASTHQQGHLGTWVRSHIWKWQLKNLHQHCIALRFIRLSCQVVLWHAEVALSWIGSIWIVSGCPMSTNIEIFSTTGYLLTLLVVVKSHFHFLKLFESSICGDVVVRLCVRLSVKTKKVSTTCYASCSCPGIW